MNRIQITDNFKWKHIVCPCCGRLIINNRLFDHMGIMQDIRDDLGFVIIITSGYRCPPHNEEEGGSEGSQHMKFATDARPEWGAGFYKRLAALYNEVDKRFKGVGKYKSWTHGDLRTGHKVRWDQT